MKVSIIIPTYNYGHFLRDCLDSVLNQTFKDFEVWVIDDGSTDNTYNLIKEYQKKDHRINYHFQQNSGLSQARNKGLDLISGDFIQFLDADDKISKDKLTLQLEEFERNSKLDISYCKTWFFDSKNPLKLFNDIDLTDSKEFLQIEGNGFIVLNELVNKNITVVSSPLIRKTSKTKDLRFNEEVKNSEDWMYWIQCAMNGCYFSYLPNSYAATMIRVHKESMSQSKMEMYYGELMLRDWIEKVLESDRFEEKEIELLRVKNRLFKENLVEHSLLTGPLWNLSHLKRMYPHTGLLGLIKYLTIAHKHQKIHFYK